MDIALFPLIFKAYHLRLLFEPLGVFTAKIMLIWTVPYILALVEPSLQLRIPRDCHIADPVVCHFLVLWPLGRPPSKSHLPLREM